MRISTIMGFLAASSVALSALGIWSFYSSFDPVPTTLNSFTGTATSIRTSTTLYTKSHATFQLRQSNGELTEFSYKPLYKGFYYFAEHLKEGAAVEVIVGPGGLHDIWGIRLDSQSLMTPVEAREVRMTDGRWGLALFLGFLVAALWSMRQSRDFRRRGI